VDLSMGHGLVVGDQRCHMLPDGVAHVAPGLERSPKRAPAVSPARLYLRASQLDNGFNRAYRGSVH
jgi:hypothetical protein